MGNTENGETKGEEVCDLEKYKILYQAYADEIKNLWQRSIFLGAFMTLAWGGYGALQLKFIEKCVENSQLPSIFHFASLGLCAVIIILSLLWVAMAKGSKFVQEAHEKHIDNLKFDYVQKNKPKDENTERLFCKLNKFDGSTTTDTSGNLTIDSNPNLFRSGALKPYRYSPSKINIALGWFSAVIATILCFSHIFIAFCCFNRSIFNDKCILISFLITAIIICFIVLCFIYCLTTDCLKGGTRSE